MTDKYDYTTRPTESREYTVYEVAAAAGISRERVYALANENGVIYTIKNIDGHRRARYSYEAMKQICELVKVDYKKRETLQLGDDEAAAHPLVKDSRFLKLSYFPDVVPACFEELGE